MLSKEVDYRLLPYIYYRVSLGTFYDKELNNYISL